jgi:rfaE bifunctional protein kinase chain/domain/rfaE bifunctional protein nucleotidyltransferase chain/domain
MVRVSGMKTENKADSKVLTLSDMEIVTRKIRESNKKIAHCHGVFDLLHPGHVQHFVAAKQMADILVVSITADKHVNKGPGRPLFTQSVRASTIAAIGVVDYVVVSNHPTAIETIVELKPDFYVKGSDYQSASDDVTGMILLEKETVESFGGKLVFTDEITSSSSKLINQFFSKLSVDAQGWLSAFKLDSGFKRTVSWLDRIENLNVLVLGEVIIDRYTECTPLAKSSKDPILAFQRGQSLTYPGGILTIANNCKGWCSEVSAISFVGVKCSNFKQVSIKVDPRIELDLVSVKDRPTILKHRFVDSGSSTRLFEYYDFKDASLEVKDEICILEKIDSRVLEADVVILADYGHGFFTNKIISKLEAESKFLAVNTQANAGNRGYNTISKYRKADLLSLNGSELQLELRDKNPDYLTIVPQMMEDKDSTRAILTLGGDGMMVFDRSGEHIHVPAFATRIVDKVGAGDSVLSISSLLTAVGAPLDVVGFVSSLVAAHEISQLGHQSGLSRNDLKKHAKSILG